MLYKDNSHSTISSLITDIAKQLFEELQEKTVAQQYAWWLLEALTEKSKIDLLLAKEVELTDKQKQLLNRWIDDIIIYHKPIAYILGSVPFGPLAITVRPPILIPRPETEEWVLHLIEQIKKSSAQNLRILDLCTGSGCIGLLFAYMLPNAHIDAVDISDEAIALATENRQKLNITNISIINSDLFEQLPDRTYDLIISNPPYITADEYRELSPAVSTWEDKGALYAHDEGLFIIKQIIEKAPSFLHSNKILQEQQINQLYIEIGWKQGDIVSKLFEKRGYTNITVEKDSAEKDRVVSGRIVNVATANIKP
jgi:release factor glutamine methyltransferase